MHTPTQLEDAEAPMAGDELTKREVHGLTLRPCASQPLRLGNDLVVDIDALSDARRNGTRLERNSRDRSRQRGA